MKKASWKRLSFIPAICLALSLSACGGNSVNNGSGNGGAATATDDAEGGNASNAAADKTPITTKVWTPYGAKGTSGVHTDAVMKELAKQTGVTLDFEYNMTQEKYNAALASGDLPDFFIVNNTDIAALINGKKVIDMEPLLAQHGQSIEKETPDKIAFSKKFMSLGQNKLYFLPTHDQDQNYKPLKTFNNGTGVGIFTRWDYYKELGYPEWQGGLDDIIPILKLMQDKHPKTEAGKKIYALSPWFGDWDLWNYTSLTQGYLNVDAEQEKFIDIEMKDGGYMKSQIGDTSSSLWTGAQFFNKAYQAGILDPDSLTQKFEQFTEKINDGRILTSFVNWATTGANAELAKNGHPDQGLMEIKLPDSVTDFLDGWIKPYADRWSFAISSDTKYPERVMDVINFLSSSDGMRLLLNGIEGQQWNLDPNGVPKLTPEAKAIRTGNVDDNKLGIGMYDHLAGRSSDTWDPKYNAYADFVNNEDPAELTAASPLAQDYVAHYGVTYPDELFTKTVPGLKKKADGSFLAMAEPTPNDIKLIDANLLNYLKGALMKAVIAKTDEAFKEEQQKIIADCKKMGYEKAYEWHKNNFEAARGKVQEFKNSLNG